MPETTNETPHVHRVRRDPRQERIIQHAIAHISRLARKHARGLALEMGQHLWVNVYERNEEYLTSRDPTKERSLGDIALATQYTSDQLRDRVVAALTREKMKAMGIELPRFDLSDFAALYKLRDHPRAAGILARWGHDQDVDVRVLKVLVGYWRDTLDSGGDIQALIDNPYPPELRKKKEKNKKDEDEKKKKRKKRKKKRRPNRSDEELRVLRILEMVRRWIRAVHFKPREKTYIRKKLARLRTALVGR